jgi:hypothetical protein
MMFLKHLLPLVTRLEGKRSGYNGLKPSSRGGKGLKARKPEVIKYRHKAPLFKLSELQLFWK